MRCLTTLMVTTWTVLSTPLLSAADPQGEIAQASLDASPFPFAIFGIATLAVAALLVAGLALWSHRQDEINSMMYFCINFLINTKNTTERYRAAKQLGHARDPGALLVLLDVINDESAEESIRKAAGDALQEMSQRYRKYKGVIEQLLAASEAKDHERVIELLKAHFEQGGKKYVQSAYVIGRELFRIGNYADARAWLHSAEFRNRNYPMYVDQIRDITNSCNRRLFAEGDMAFKAGDYHQAHEHYALSSHGLSPEVNKHFASYLRAACTFCKLGEYENASQSILQGLHRQQETDKSLELNGLINRLLNQLKEHPQAMDERQKIEKEIDRFVNLTMDDLITRLSRSR